MGLVKIGFGLVLFGALGAAYIMPPTDQTSSNVALSIPQDNDRFQLLEAGVETGCYVSKGQSLGERRAELVFDRGCNDISADYAEARIWSEEEDGSVALITRDGAVTLRLAAGDGLAYEAFGAGAPLVALSYATN